MRKRGFTLIELLVVLAILGVLVAMVAPRLARGRSGPAGTNGAAPASVGAGSSQGSHNSWQDAKSKDALDLLGRIAEGKLTQPNDIRGAWKKFLTDWSGEAGTVDMVSKIADENVKQAFIDFLKTK